MAKIAVETVLQNKYGFHARPSTTFALLAKQYQAAITVCVDGIKVDGKSVMALMSLGATRGSRVRIEAEGEDAEKAVAALKSHVDDRFGGIE